MIKWHFFLIFVVNLTEYDFRLIVFFMRSFGRRNFCETSICIAENFVFQTPMIELEGREKFIKLQKKLDSNFNLSVPSIKASSVKDVYDLHFIYCIYLHTHPKIEIEAHSKIHVFERLISKMTVKFDNEEYAKTVFMQMMYH